VLVHKHQWQREAGIMGSSAQLDFGLRSGGAHEHMSISAIGARAQLIGIRGIVLFVFWEV